VIALIGKNTSIRKRKLRIIFTLSAPEDPWLQPWGVVTKADMINALQQTFQANLNVLQDI